MKRSDLVVPASRTRTFGPRAFAISGPDSWNNIPVALRDTALSFHEFCVKLKTELYRQINWNWTISAFMTVSTVRSFSARWTNFAYLLTYLLNMHLMVFVFVFFSSNSLHRFMRLDIPYMMIWATLVKISVSSNTRENPDGLLQSCCRGGVWKRTKCENEGSWSNMANYLK